MYLIVGLGNPGKIYAHSRHNIGFSVIEALAKSYKIKLKKDNFSFSLSGKGRIEGQNAVLSMPLTFMNLSGVAVKALVKKYKIDCDKLLIICDDLDLELGRLKIKASGSSGGHRGLKSVIDFLGSQDFSRLRVGIGRPPLNFETSGYVLSAFSKGQKGQARDILERAQQCCRVWIKEGIRECMNIFNRRSQ